MRARVGWLGSVGGGAVLAGVLFAVAPASAQMDPEEEQRCVWQCLANSPGADSRQYNDCVAQMCMAEEPAAPAPAAPAVPRATWTAGAAPSGEHFAGVEVPGAAMTYICKPGGSGQIGIGGVGGRGDAVAFAVDRQAYGLPFSVRRGVLFTDAPAGSHLVAALMSGDAVHVRDAATGRSVSFPLTGSGAAIGKALAGCGVRR